MEGWMGSDGILMSLASSLESDDSHNIYEESSNDFDDSQNTFVESSLDSPESQNNSVELYNSDISQNNPGEPSMESDESQIISEPDSSESYSPITWYNGEDSETSSTPSEALYSNEEQERFVPGESANLDNNASGPAHNTRTRAQRDVNRQRQLESEQDNSNSTTDMTEDSSRTSLPQEEQSTDANEPPAKVRKLSSPIPEGADGNDADGETCPICLDSWGNSGDHRLVALKCGHLFGFKCVERWIRGKNNKDRSCPTCKSKASIKDIRYIYAKRLVAVDTTELIALQKQVETVQMEKNQIQMELQTTKLEHRSIALQLELLRKTLAMNAGGKQVPRRNWRFALDKNLEVWRDGGCRVLAYNCRTYEFYVSQKTTNNLFPGFGVRPVSCIDYKLGPLIPLHPKAIRDVAYSQPTDLLMSVGLDGAVKIVERGIPTTSIQCGMPLWSCAWDHARPNHFYIGGVGGIIMSYDVRNTNAVMETLSTPGDMSPSVSLVSTEFGLLSCQLNSAWLWRSKAAGATPQPLPVKGPFVSLCYDQESKRVAISCRPGINERAKVALFKVHKTVGNEVSCDLVENMYGSSRSTVMSRAAFVKCAESAWVAAYSESDSSLLLHSLDGSRTMSLPAAEAALDVCAGQVNGETILAALSDSRLRLYKSYPSSSA